MPDYIRINNLLPDSAKVMQLSREWACSLDEALGGMVRWLCWLDLHTTDGKTGLTVSELSELIFHDDSPNPNVVDGLIAIGWAAVGKDGYVYSVDFEKYNGPTAKLRAWNAARQKACRKRKKSEI